MNQEESQITNEKRVEILLQHYQDTFQLILNNTKIRNRLFIYCLVILSVIIFDICSPDSLSELLNAYLKKSLNDQVKLNFNIIISAIWFLLLCLVIEYYKRSIHIDRQYRYLSNVENGLNTIMGGELITREGKAYESRTGVPGKDGNGKRPFCLRAIGPLYTFIFPIALIGIILLKMFYQFSFREGTIIFNSIIGLVVIFYSGSYLVWMFGKKKS